MAVIAGLVIVGEVAASPDLPTTGSRLFARPKSSTFTVPSGRSFTFAGLRSRWTIPCSWAASSASAICRAIGMASLTGIGPSRNAIGERRTLDELQHERLKSIGFFEAVNRRDVRMIERGEDLRFALEAREPLLIEGEAVGQDLERDVALERRVARAIDLAHTARAERGQNFVRAESIADGESSYRRESCSL